MNYDELCQRITGPVFPVLVPFQVGGDIDHAGLRSYARFLVDGGAKVLLLTAGTSRLNLLSTEEVQACNAAVVEAVGDRALVIASGPAAGSTRANVEVVEHAAAIGAKAVLLVHPDRWYGDEEVATFFRDVADATDLGVLVHAMPMRNGFGGVNDTRALDAGILEHIAEHPKVIGVKEENGDRAVFEKIYRTLGSRLAVIGAGGAMRRFLNDRMLGCDTYLVGIESFLPQVGVDFHAAAMAGDRGRAEQLAAAEDLFFEFAVPLGWHRVLKETLAILGLMPPHERRPLTRIPAADRARLRDLLEHQGWSIHTALSGVGV